MRRVRNSKNPAARFWDTRPDSRRILFGGFPPGEKSPLHATLLSHYGCLLPAHANLQLGKSESVCSRRHPHPERRGALFGDTDVYCHIGKIFSFLEKILENRYNINMGFIIEFIIKNIKEKGKKMMILVI